MKLSITKGLPPDKALEITQDFKAAYYLRERITTLLNEKVESSRISVRSRNTYESPAWAYVQADQIGYERAIFELISLLSSKDGEKE